MIRWPAIRGDAEAGLVLRFGRVYLRPPRRGDWREWASLRAASREFLAPWEPTWARDALSRAAFRRRLRQYREELRGGVGYRFLAFRREDDTMLGGINLTNVRGGIIQAGNLGYWIGAPYAGQGYMTESMQCILVFAFDRLGLHRVEAACIPENTRSESLLRRAGFRLEGRAREYLRINGAWHDHLTFAILREDWEAATPPAASPAASAPGGRADQSA